jgi:CheY-like chemotaxis protein
MNKAGPIIIIEDDKDDRDILNMVFGKLDYPNDVIFFPGGEEALSYLDNNNVRPFLILSDINMPKMDGFELRSAIFSNEQLHTRCIPYLFFTTGANKQSVEDAYAMSVQGFFVKAGLMDDLENTIRKIVDYWRECIAPSDYY